jgi:hypothetical protein
MTDVFTRQGIFGPGGYGGGVFDGSDMGFGGLGDFEQAAAGVRGLGAVPTYNAPDGYVLSLQKELNLAMGTGEGGYGCTAKLVEDGVIGQPPWGQYASQSKTCWALQWIYLATAKTGRPVSQRLRDLLTAHGADFNAGCEKFTPVSFSCPTIDSLQPPPPPEPVGPTAQEVIGLQQVLNPALFVLGFETIAENGVVNGVLCGAIRAVNRGLSTADPAMAANAKAFLQDWIDFNNFAGPTFQGWCDLVNPATWVTPARSAVVPTPAPVPVTSFTSAQVKTVQQAVNKMLFITGQNTIWETGVFDAVLCGALQAANGALRERGGDLPASATPLVQEWFNVMAMVGAGVDAECAKIRGPWPQPGMAQVAPPPTPGKDPCKIEFGDSSLIVAKMQQEMNLDLEMEGYAPITVSGFWDAATCGALFVLKGVWDPQIAACGGGGWTVPAACPPGVAPIIPVKIDDEPIDDVIDEPVTKTSTATAWMLGGLVAAAAVTGLYMATKRR